MLPGRRAFFHSLLPTIWGFLWRSSWSFSRSICKCYNIVQWVDKFVQTRIFRSFLCVVWTFAIFKHRISWSCADSKSHRKGDKMASKLLIPLLLATICGLTVVTASESGNFKDSRLISMPTATREKHILVLVAQVYAYDIWSLWNVQSLDTIVTDLNILYYAVRGA